MRSIGPILAVPGIREAIIETPAPVIAVSPIVGGQAIKGPTAKMMRELGLPSTAVEVARHYAGLIDGFVLDSRDAEAANAVRELGIAVTVTNTVMTSLEDRIALAEAVLAFAAGLPRASMTDALTASTGPT